MRYVLYLTLFIIAIGTVPTSQTVAQDIHFTNFRMAPLSVNPALTGSFRGTYRISGIYRSQWASTDNSNAFKTPFASAELNIAKDLLLENDWVSGGVSFLRDRSGSLNFSTQSTALNVGYHIGMDSDYKNVFSVGVNYGSQTRGVDTQGITPEAVDNTQPGQQIIPVDVVLAGAGEQQRTTSYNSLAVGVAYKTELDNGTLVRFGINGSHLLGGEASLFTAQRDSIGGGGPPPNPNPNTRFDPVGAKFIIHGESSFLATEKLRINPAVFFQTRSGFSEFAVQSTADYLLNAEKQMTVMGGLGYRFGDAFELMGGVQIKNLRVMLSYDLTTSSYTQAGGGAFELAVGYVGTMWKNPNVKPVIFCPRL